MSTPQCANVQGDFLPTHNNISIDDCIEEVKQPIVPCDNEIHMLSDTTEVTPRSNQSGASRRIVNRSSIPKQKPGHRSNSANFSKLKSPGRSATPTSSIPLPVKLSGPIKIPPSIMSTVKNRSNSVSNRPASVANKHTLEIQFINKNKRYQQMKKDLVDKQRPVVDLYQNLIQIKKRLEELGKTVKLEEIKLVPFEEYKKPTNMHGDGEQISLEVVTGMKHSIEEIPKTLMDICKNLLSRRALIVELLESVTKSEIDVSEVSSKIESLKNEGQQLQNSLDAVISEHQTKINLLVNNWQKLLNEKQSNNDASKIEDLESKLEEKEKLIQESNNIIQDLYKQMSDRNAIYDKSVADLNEVILSLKEKIKKLDQEIEAERRTNIDYKSRNNTNSQNLKLMRDKIAELENEKKNVENSNTELQKKIRILQDQLKHKETIWCHERTELNKNLKHQENLLQKLTAAKNQFETRLESIEKDKVKIEKSYGYNIDLLTSKLDLAKGQLEEAKQERNVAVEKCSEYENYISEMEKEYRERMKTVSYSIEWGKAVGMVKQREHSPAEAYIEQIAKDLKIRELEDTILNLENERKLENSTDKQVENSENIVSQPRNHLDDIDRFLLFLEEIPNHLENKLNILMTTEIEKLNSQIRELNVRQSSLEEQSSENSSKALLKILDESRKRLHKLNKRYKENKQTVEKYVVIIEKQSRRIRELETLLRYRENITNVLKASRNELILEKESVTRYANELRTLLVEFMDKCKSKESIVKELQDTLNQREEHILYLEKIVEKLEAEFRSQKSLQLQETTYGKHTKNVKEESRHQISPYNVDVNNIKGNLNHKYQRPIKDLPQAQLDQNYSRNCSGIFYGHQPKRSDNIMKWNLKSLNQSNFSLTRTNSESRYSVDSRSLISLSLQKVDFLKTRLNFLTTVNMKFTEEMDESSLSKVQKKKKSYKKNSFKKLGNQ